MKRQRQAYHLLRAMAWYGIITALLLAPPESHAQRAAPLPGGARGIALGGLGSGFRDAHSALTNPAGLAFTEHFRAMATAENRFLMREMRVLNAAVALPASGGAFGASIHYYGFELYNEQRLGLAYARRLSPGFALGGQILLLHTRIPDYGNRAWLTFELGIQADLLPELTLGARVYNPTRQAAVEGQYLPTVFTIGLSYRPSEQLLLGLDAEKDIDFPPRIRGGVEYRAINALALRFGAATRPAAMSFGLGLRLPGGFGIDLASQYHPFLGLSPAIGLLWDAPAK